jgi:2-polyprenyl-3-methyl-5-hydroxy-6-metoxy-1,4-benzoquinol methylase
MPISSCALCGRSETTHLCTRKGFNLARCNSCELVFVTNPPRAEELTRFYSFAHGYHAHYAAEAGCAPAEAAAQRHLSDLRRYKSGGRLLDVGCAAGIFLKKARADGWEVSGIEFSEDSAAVARRRFSLEVTAGTLRKGIFPPASFDAVTLWDVVEHLPDPIAGLSAAGEILKEDGVLLIETPNIDGLYPRLSYAIASDGRYWRHPEPPAHLFQFSKRSLRRALDSAGLRAIHIADRRIPLSYSFGAPGALMRSPKGLLYALAFAPFAAMGPLLRQGDSMVVAAVRRTR